MNNFRRIKIIENICWKKNIQDLEEENKTVVAELGEKKADLGAMEREKDKLYSELKQSRYEVRIYLYPL